MSSQSFSKSVKLVCSPRVLFLQNILAELPDVDAGDLETAEKRLSRAVVQFSWAEKVSLPPISPLACLH